MSLWSRLFGKRNTEYDELDEWWDDEDTEEESCPGHTLDVSVPDLTRNLLYDMGFTDPEAAMRAVGYPGQSEDVSDMSRDASDQRMLGIIPVAHIASVLTDLVMGALNEYSAQEVATTTGQIDGMEIDKAMVAVASALRARETKAVVFAVLANLIDLGLLEATQMVTVHEGGSDE